MRKFLHSMWYLEVRNRAEMDEMNKYYKMQEHNIARRRQIPAEKRQPKEANVIVESYQKLRRGMAETPETDAGRETQQGNALQRISARACRDSLARLRRPDFPSS